MYSLRRKMLCLILAIVTFCCSGILPNLNFGSGKKEVTTANAASSTLFGFIADSNLRTASADYESVVAQNNPVGVYNGVAWRNDIIYSRIVLYTKGVAVSNVTVTVGEFTNAAGDKLPADSVKVSFIHDTYDHMYGVDVADVIWNSTTEDIPAETLKSVWVTIEIPRDAKVGVYSGSINVTADDGSSLSFPHNVEVIGLTRLDGAENDVQLELWTFPYAVDRYYSGKTSDEYFYGATDGIPVDPMDGIGKLCNIYLNDEFEEQRRGHLELYAKAGGRAITTTCVEDPWGSQTPDPYPSMIKWTKKADGTFAFDYSDFDKWVQMNLDYGIDGQIKTFSIISWHGIITYYDEATETTKADWVPVRINKGTDQNPVYEANPDWAPIWTEFLRDYMAHTKEKGWFDMTYMALDERELPEVKAALDLVKSITDENGKSFKVSLATNWNGSESEYYRIDDLSYAYQLGNQHKFPVKESATARKENGQLTTIYTCGSQCNSLICTPAENYFGFLNMSKFNVDGFLRWALDAFNEHPLETGDGTVHPSGDIFLIYPSDVGDTSGKPRSSIRFEKMTEGLRMFSKIKTMRSYSAEISNKIDEILAKLCMPYYDNKEIINAETGVHYNYYSVLGYIDASGNKVPCEIDFATQVNAAVAELNALARKFSLQTLVDEAKWEKATPLTSAISAAEAILNNSQATDNDINLGYQALNAAMDEYNLDEIAEISANDVVGWEGATPEYDARGAKSTIVKDGGQARINYNGKLNGAFSIENGNTVSVKFSVGMHEASSKSHTQEWESSSFFVILRDFATQNELMRVKVKINNTNGESNPIDVIPNAVEGQEGLNWDVIGYNNGIYQTGYKWIKGSPTLDNQFEFAFNTTDLMMSNVYNETTYVYNFEPIVDNVGSATEIGCGAWYYDQVKNKLNGVKYICFDIQGNGGFDKNTDVIVTEINGQSLANDGSAFNAKGMTATLGETAATVEAGSSYQVPFTAKHLWNNDGGVQYSIKWSGAATQTEKEGLVFNPTVAGEYNVTVTASHVYFGNVSKSFDVTVNGVDMTIYGSSIRKIDSALRFMARVNKADYQAFIDQGCTVEVGIIAIKSSLSQDLTLDTEKVLNIKMENKVINGDYILFNGVITDFPKAAYGDDITARVYIKITDNGSTVIQYSEIMEKNFLEVATAELADVSETNVGEYVNEVTIGGQQKWSKYTQAQIDLLESYFE